MESGINNFKIAKIFAVLLAVVAIVLSVCATKNENNLPANFYTPIIALEFIQNTSEVQHFFDVKNVENYEQDLLLGNNIDYLFMAVYSCFLFFIALGIKKNTQSKSMYAVMILCVVMLVCDALENHQIAQIIFYYKSSASIETFLSKLSFFTWLKWSSIATTFLLFAPYFLKGNLFQKAIGIFEITSFILCVAAFLHHGILNEIFAGNIIFVFLLLVIFVFTKNANHKLV